MNPFVKWKYHIAEDITDQTRLLALKSKPKKAEDMVVELPELGRVTEIMGGVQNTVYL